MASCKRLGQMLGELQGASLSRDLLVDLPAKALTNLFEALLLQRSRPSSAKLLRVGRISADRSSFHFFATEVSCMRGQHTLMEKPFTNRCKLAIGGVLWRHGHRLQAPKIK